MVQVVWTRRALADLAAIQTYIHRSRPIAARRMALRLQEIARSLSENPDRGRPAGAFREITTIWPYVIRYRIGRDAVQVLRIRHGARRPD